MNTEDRDILSGIERENVEASIASRQHEADDDEVIPEDDIEPSEEDIALDSLDKEHMQDYQAIKHAVEHTDLAERLVDMAVLAGKRERSQNKLGL